MQGKSQELFAAAKKAVLSQLHNEIPDNGMHYQWIMAKTSVAKGLTYETYVEAINAPAKASTAHFDELQTVVESIKTEIAKLA